MDLFDIVVSLAVVFGVVVSVVCAVLLMISIAEGYVRNHD